MGWTSFDVVKKVRQITGESKVGHAGTLDPFAEGVLVIGIGRQSTRQLGEISNSIKSYRASLRLGEMTDTLDNTGKIIREMSIPQLVEIEVAGVLAGFLGPQMQVPPMFSAKKVDGRRLYKLARNQITVDREPVAITIENIELIDLGISSIEFSVTCSKGTYVRQLGSDIATALGTVGHLTRLKRVDAGRFTLDDCINFEEIEEQWMSSII
tara:strand:- start:8707 stop:9339 length:633 start_codon:yes stop_codon:yes gene_type:complete